MSCLPVLLLAGVSLVASGGAELEGRWTWKNPEVPLVGWQELFFEKGGFVATTMGHGERYLFTSEDGLSWTERIVPTGQGLWKLAFVNNRFIAANSEGILTSINGLNWSIAHLENYGFWGFAYGNGTYVGVGSAATIATSVDGEKWALIQLPREDGYRRSLLGVAFGNEKFVAIGGHGYLLTSEDGKQWSRHSWPGNLPIAEYSPVALTFSDGSFHYWGAFSDDGVNWKPETNSITLRAIRTPAGELVALDSSTILVSKDGSAWETAFRSEVGEYLKGLAFGNGRFVALGERGLIVHSTDGRNWESRPPATAAQKVVFGNGHFLRYGGTNLSRSVDGSEWEILPVPEAFEEVLHGNEQFIATTSSGGIYGSLDGNEWQKRADAEPFVGLQFLGDLFFVRHTNGILRASRDTREWRDVTIILPGEPDDEPIRILAYGNDRYLALGYRYVYSSRDGFSWEKIALAPPYGFRMAFGNGKFLLAGQAGMGPASLYVSETGHEWKDVRGGGATHLFYGFGFAAEHFFMLDTWGAIHFSKDGARWEYNRLTHTPLWGLAEGNGVILVTGSGEIVQKSLKPIPLKWLPLDVRLKNGRRELHGSPTAWPVRIETSSDFTTWKPAATFNQEDETGILFHSLSEEKMEFYRAREVNLNYR